MRYSRKDVRIYESTDPDMDAEKMTRTPTHLKLQDTWIQMHTHTHTHFDTCTYICMYEFIHLCVGSALIESKRGCIVKMKTPSFFIFSLDISAVYIHMCEVHEWTNEGRNGIPKWCMLKTLTFSRSLQLYTSSWLFSKLFKNKNEISL